MFPTDADIQEMQAIISPLIGKSAWAVSLGFGSFVTMEFGKAISPVNDDDEKVHGEWHLWVYNCSWRLEIGDEILVGSEDPRPEIEKALTHIENVQITAVDIKAPSFETTFYFGNDISLHLFPVLYLDLKHSEHWMLFTPNGKVLSCGPGTKWSYEMAD